MILVGSGEQLATTLTVEPILTVPKSVVHLVPNEWNNDQSLTFVTYGEAAAFFTQLYRSDLFDSVGRYSVDIPFQTMDHVVETALRFYGC